MIYLIILCVISIVINVLLIWYIRKMLTKLLFVSNNIGGLLDSLDLYTEHLDNIYEMETFYGDETLHALITHSKDISNQIKGYREIYSLTEQEELELPAEYLEEEIE